MRDEFPTIDNTTQGIEYQIFENVPLHKRGTRVFWPQGSFYFNTQKRVATVTDVKYLSATRIVVAHRAAAKLYLLEVQGDSFRQIDSLLLDSAKYSLNIKRRFGSKRYFHPDLIAVNKNKIYMSEYTDRCSIVSVKGDRLVYEDTIHLGGHGFHGCASDGNNIVFGSIKDGFIASFDPSTKEVTRITTDIDSDKRIKAISIERDYLVMSVDRQTGKPSKEGATVDCWLELHIRDGKKLKRLDSLSLPCTQIDGHCFYKGYHFITSHDGASEKGIILVAQIREKKLVIVKRVFCENFPHGLDALNDQIIYTSYAKSAVVQLELATLLP